MQRSHFENPAFKFSGIFMAPDLFRTLSRHILQIQSAICNDKFWHIYGPRLVQDSVYIDTFRHIQAYSIMIFIIILTSFFSLLLFNAI